jgi:hypothetical protein
MNTLDRSKKDLMLHTGCGFVSSSIKHSGLSWFLFLAGLIPVLAYIILML